MTESHPTSQRLETALKNVMKTHSLSRAQARRFIKEQIDLKTRLKFTKGQPIGTSGSEPTHNSTTRRTGSIKLRVENPYRELVSHEFDLLTPEQVAAFQKPHRRTTDRVQIPHNHPIYDHANKRLNPLPLEFISKYNKKWRSCNGCGIELKVNQGTYGCRKCEIREYRRYQRFIERREIFPHSHSNSSPSQAPVSRQDAPLLPT